MGWWPSRGSWSSGRLLRTLPTAGSTGQRVSISSGAGTSSLARSSGAVFSGAGPGRRHERVGQLLGVGVLRVEPGVPVLGGQDHRHAVVDRLHQVVGRGGEDGAGPQLVAVAVLALGFVLLVLG